MKLRLLLILLILMTSTNVFAQTIKERLKQARQQENEEQQQSAITEKLYPNGQLKEQSEYVNGIRHGKANFYYSNGALLASEQYEKGKLLDSSGVPVEGKKVYYNEDGSIRMEFTYINGLLEGIQKEYDDQGNLYAESTWVNNRREGLTKIFSKDGQAVQEANWKNNKRHGFSDKFDEKGHLISSKVFEEGKLIK